MNVYFCDHYNMVPCAPQSCSKAHHCHCCIFTTKNASFYPRMTDKGDGAICSLPLHMSLFPSFLCPASLFFFFFFLFLCLLFPSFRPLSSHSFPLILASPVRLLGESGKCTRISKLLKLFIVRARVTTPLCLKSTVFSVCCS